MIKIRPVQEPNDVIGLPGSEGRQGLPSAGDWLQPVNLGLLAVTETDEPMGWLLLVPDKQVGPAAISFRLAWLIVAEAYRRQGVATALLEAAARAAAERGARCVHASLRPHNAASLALLDGIAPNGGAPFIVDLSHGGF